MTSIGEEDVLEKMRADDTEQKTDPVPWCAATYCFDCHVDVLRPCVDFFCRIIILPWRDEGPPRTGKFADSLL